MASKVYIIIVNYKKWQDTRDCLESLLRSTHRQFTVIVTDNDSGNDSLENLAAWAEGKTEYRLFRRNDWEDGRLVPSMLPRLVLLQNDRNKGFAEGNNVAIRPLLTDNAYVWLLNPDMTVQENTLAELVQFSAGRPFKTITGAVIKYFDPPHAIHLYGGGSINWRSGTVALLKEEADLDRLDYISGGALFTHTAHFNDIGLLPEEYFLYWEETDWCSRAKGIGYALQVCSGAICFDKISTTIGRGFLADYFYTRNGLLFLSKFKKDPSGVAMSLTLLRFLKRVSTGKWKRAWGVYKGYRAFLKIRSNENK
jgi:GT2 family glycosyltransferase